MRELSIKRDMSVIGGILVIVFYCVFTLISWALYPLPYTPWDNYLSRLGNLNYSSFGAWFYNIGCIVTGIALFPFFVGLYRWHRQELMHRAVMIVGQVLGLASGVALILIGVFSEDQGAPHMAASSIFFLLNFFVLLILCIALGFHPDFNRLFALYGIILDGSTFIFAFTTGGPLLEWYTVFGSLVFVGLVALSTLIQNE